MGYRRPSYRLTFEDPQFEGLEVSARGMSIESMLDLMKLADINTSEDLSDEDREKILALCDTFGSALVSWNLEDDQGQPVPADANGLRKQDLGLLLGLVQSYTSGVIDVSVPLGRKSSGGMPLAEASLPMEALSESPNS